MGFCRNDEADEDCGVGSGCSEEAKNAPYGGGGCSGLDRHSHDCGGLLPCLLLDSYAGWPKSSPEGSIGGPDMTHLAYACVADTSPTTILDYLCQTGVYKVGPTLLPTLFSAFLKLFFSPRPGGLQHILPIHPPKPGDRSS